MHINQENWYTYWKDEIEKDMKNDKIAYKPRE